MQSFFNPPGYDGIVDLLANIKKKIKITINEYKNYLDCLKDEKFEEKPNEKEDEAIKRAESIYDRLDEIIKRNQIVLKNGKETIDLIDGVRNKIDDIVKSCQSDEFLLKNKNNDLIDEIIELEEKKTKKILEPYQNQIDLINQKLNNKKNEWRNQKIKEEVTNVEFDIKKVYTNNLSLDEMKQIEEWTGMAIGNIIFDSDIDNWGVNDSVFLKNVWNKNDLTFLIEDDDGNLFGGYINAKMDKCNTYINDPNAFVFSLRSNGRLPQRIKFNIINSTKAICLCDQPTICLFSFGNDIFVSKKSNSGYSFCDQSLFQYLGFQNALCGKTGRQNLFNLKRITVFQLFRKEFIQTQYYNEDFFGAFE